MNISGVGTVIVPVGDQEKALSFYLDTLGFEIRRDADFGGMRWVEVAPSGATTTLALFPSGEAGSGGMEISFTTKDADADHAALRARGVDADEAVIRMGEIAPPMFTFRDPDGNKFRMVQQA